MVAYPLLLLLLLLLLLPLLLPGCLLLCAAKHGHAWVHLPSGVLPSMARLQLKTQPTPAPPAGSTAAHTHQVRAPLPPSTLLHSPYPLTLTPHRCSIHRTPLTLTPHRCSTHCTPSLSPLNIASLTLPPHSHPSPLLHSSYPLTLTPHRCSTHCTPLTLTPHRCSTHCTPSPSPLTVAPLTLPPHPHPSPLLHSPYPLTLTPHRCSIHRTPSLSPTHISEPHAIKWSLVWTTFLG